LIIQLVLSGHLKEIFHSTAYSINVYLQLGPQAVRLTRLGRDAIMGGSGPRIECAFLQRSAGGRAKAGENKARKPASKQGGKKGKSKALPSDEDDDAEDLAVQIEEELGSADSDELEDADEDGWSYSLMPRRKGSSTTKGPPSQSRAAPAGVVRKRRRVVDRDESEDDGDVIVLSS
jgi:ATP-dependent DNA helicase Q1